MKPSTLLVRSRFALIYLTLGASLHLPAEPTESRTWLSTAGTKLEAKATARDGQAITLVTDQGRTLTVQLSQLSDADQVFLKEHFGTSVPLAPESQAPSLSEPLGQMIGPISADSDSSYFLYLPTTLVEGIDAPIIFWTGSGQSNQQQLQPFVEVAELTGMVLAASVESKNGTNAFEINNSHTEDCLKDIKKKFPVDITRAFFSGSSGGGASAFYNASTLKSAGALPMVAYIPDGSKPTKKGFYYILGGARDYNRYSSARAAADLGARATYRMHAGGHGPAKEPAIFEGSLWLYTRHLYEQEDDFSAEISHFEPRLTTFLKDCAESNPHTAYFWTNHLLNSCQIDGNLKSFVSELHETLAQSDDNINWLAGHQALEALGENIFATEKVNGSQSGHTSPAIESEVESLQQKYGSLTEIDRILQDLAQPTVTFK